MAAHLAGQRRLFEDTQRLLVEHAAWLQPGDWVPVPPKQNVWHHADAVPPPAVVARGGKAAFWVADGSDRSGRAALKRLWRGMWLWAFAMAARVRRLRATVPVVPSRGNATTVVKASPGPSRGTLIGLEPAAGRALRFATAGTYDQGYAEARERFARHLPCPGFTVEDHGAVLVEEWVEGRPLKGLPVERAVSVVVEVLERYADLVAHESVSDHGSAWQALPRLFDEITVPAELREPLADPRVRRLLNIGSLTPSQGDFSPANFLVDERRGSWQVVDFDDAGWLPSWWDPLLLATNIPLQFFGMTKQAEPRLTAGLEHMWAAARVQEVRGLSLQHYATLLIVRTAWSASTGRSYVSGNGPFTEPDPDDFAWHLQQQAHKFKPRLAGL